MEPVKHLTCEAKPLGMYPRSMSGFFPFAPRVQNNTWSFKCTEPMTYTSTISSGGWPIPLKNDGVRQWVSDDIPYRKWNIKHVWNHQSFIARLEPLNKLKDQKTLHIKPSDCYERTVCIGMQLKRNHIMMWGIRHSNINGSVLTDKTRS